MTTEKFKEKFAVQRPYMNYEMKDLIKRWYQINEDGPGDQNTILAIQELSELTVVLTNTLRPDRNTSDTWYDIIQEMADVYNVLEYMKIKFGITDDEIRRARSVQLKIDKLVKIEEKTKFLEGEW